MTHIAWAFLKSWWGVTFLLAVGWQLIMTLFGVIGSITFGDSNPTALEHTTRWDGGWYLSILGGSYADPTSPSPAFYPLFPFIVHLAQLITFQAVDVLILGLAINTASLWLALAALLKIAEFFAPPRYRWWAVALFLASPAAIFMHMFYSEALFCAVAFWAYLFALRKQWAYMAILLAVASAARLPAILIIGLCGLEFMRSYGWRLKDIANQNLLWFLLAPLGFVVYGLYLYSVRGDFLAMFHSYDLTQDWAYHVLNPNVVHTALKEAYHVLLVAIGSQPLTYHVVVSSILPLGSLAILLAASLYALVTLKGKAVPLGIAGIASAILFTLNNNTVSVHRYVLPCLVIYAVAVAIISKYSKMRAVLYGAIYVGVLTQAYLIFLFVSGRFAG